MLQTVIWKGLARIVYWAYFVPIALFLYLGWVSVGAKSLWGWQTVAAIGTTVTGGALVLTLVLWVAQRRERSRS